MATTIPDALLLGEKLDGIHDVLDTIRIALVAFVVIFVIAVIMVSCGEVCYCRWKNQKNNGGSI